MSFEGIYQLLPDCPTTYSLSKIIDTDTEIEYDSEVLLFSNEIGWMTIYSEDHNKFTPP